MGSIWEAGYFYALNKPIVYFCAGLPPNAKFNLMLAASGVAVCTSIEDLRDYLTQCREAGKLLHRTYGGLIE
jgi:nucleoside 2-deoxyribosyltransferase